VETSRLRAAALRAGAWLCQLLAGVPSAPSWAWCSTDLSTARHSARVNRQDKRLSTMTHAVKHEWHEPCGGRACVQCCWCWHALAHLHCTHVHSHLGEQKATPFLQRQRPPAPVVRRLPPSGCATIYGHGPLAHTRLLAPLTAPSSCRQELTLVKLRSQVCSRFADNTSSASCHRAEDSMHYCWHKLLRTVLHAKCSALCRGALQDMVIDGV
jgi:hypothetical protein